MTQTIVNRIIKSIARTLSKPVKAHAKASPVELSIKAEDILVHVDGPSCILRTPDFSVEFDLSRHWKSGNLYAHWIRLNKALVQLDHMCSVGAEWPEMVTWFDYDPDCHLQQRILGFPETDEFFLTVTPQMIRKAYRRQAHRYHPDRGGKHELMDQLTWAKNSLLWAISPDFSMDEPVQEPEPTVEPEVTPETEVVTHTFPSFVMDGVLGLLVPEVTVTTQQRFLSWFDNTLEDRISHILDLPSDEMVSASDVRKAYKRQSLLAHPDRGGCSVAMDELNWAKEAMLASITPDEEEAEIESTITHTPTLPQPEEVVDVVSEKKQRVLNQLDREGCRYAIKPCGSLVISANRDGSSFQQDKVNRINTYADGEFTAYTSSTWVGMQMTQTATQATDCPF